MLCHSLVATVVAGSTVIGACTETADKETDVATVTEPSGNDTGGEASVPGGTPSGDSNPLPSLTPSASEVNTTSNGGAGGANEATSSLGGGGSGESAPSPGGGGSSEAASSLGGGGSTMNNVPLGGNAGTELNDSGAAGLREGAQATSDAGPSGSPLCPASLEEAYPYLSPAVCPEPGLQCDVPVVCNSGTQMLTLTCVDAEWDGASDCDKPFDYCPETYPGGEAITPGLYCLDGQWRVEDYLRGLADGLSGCPAEPPLDGDECRRGGTGGVDRDNCGYACPDDPSKWTLIGCVDPLNTSSPTWSSDGACD